jgi:predicted enzyme related to lactoylglutathione lyase
MADTQRPYPQGTPCWLDMYADDQDAALRFYHELFGWTGEPNPRQEGYAVLSLDGKAVAGIGPKMRGMPGRALTWNLYFAIADIETAAERITKLGGILYFGPADVPQVGRQLLAADPASAPFGLWQAAPFPGFEARMQPGTPVWFELETPQGPHSADFYGALLGAEVPKTPMEPDSYWVLMVNGEQAAGIWQAGHTADSPQRAARWRPYFLVAETDAAAHQAIAAGARLVTEPKDSPYGRLCTLRDPQGAEFSVIASPAPA